ncbi:Sel1-like repeat-containing protein kinase family protein [Thiomicrorhabdus sp. zzn3]|uniref:Sel1-like repeat-containing protein kinase family protein n=1 Tax=Thiomicrorhabdus sp. zzn3 TaxID=3039775 RepID=UPI0024367504|nr:Sel1-like repeat-containing protein kinase family protein [Thiomicrorhabdus sp. zzn3]MDG6778851.1 Sel1-like repeat-containing protein kinase family protein [Thiomicrorhabdus sp. zzn3]
MKFFQEIVLPDQGLLEQQADIKSFKPFKTGAQSDLNRPARFYRIKQKTEQGKQRQLLQVVDNLQNHYALKRQKDLLHYLNRFEKVFLRFNEIRKVDMRYLLFFEDGGKYTLKTVVRKKGGLSAKKTLQLMAELLKALEILHHVGFVHAAIRPEAILMGKKRAYLIDWCQALPELSSYETELLPEECRYCPPERLNGQHDVKSDVYQLGCTLYFALTGKHIFRLEKEESVDRQIWAHTHHSIRKINRLPVFWRYLILWMTQKDPQKRPGLLELKDWLKHQTVPKWVRKQAHPSIEGYPDDCISALADEHYDFAIYQKARRLEAEGKLESAFNLYENGAFRSYSLAEFRLGRMYLQGKCVSASNSMAAHLFQQASNKGHPTAAFNLAKMFELGIGLHVDKEKAMRLYEYSALRGDADAQYRLGQLFLHGENSDLNQAMSWLKLAAYYGYARAQVLLDEIT